MKNLLVVATALALMSATLAAADTSAVLFQVDMSVQEDIGAFDPGSGDVVFVRGGLAPLDWGTGIQLVEGLEPGVYEGIADFDNADSGTDVDYKFVMVVGGQDIWELDGGPNRSFLFEGENLALEVVYFDDFLGFTERDVTVTFNVLENDDCDLCTIDQMAIRGGSAPLNWDDDSNLLVDQGGGMWSISLFFPAGTTPKGTISYKYRAHADSKPERFDMQGDPCDAWDPATNWMWQDLRHPHPGDCFANLSFVMDDSNPTMELDVDEWYPQGTGVGGDRPNAPAAPARASLSQNSPNPFNPSTTIRFELADAGPVELAVYDLSGHKIAVLAEGLHAAGGHTVGWKPDRLASGVYLIRLVAGETRLERSMVLLK